MDLSEGYCNKKILVTGGGGFIGSNLANRLVNLGAEVTLMDSKLINHGFNEFNLKNIKDKVKLDYSDIRDEQAVIKNISGKDIIFNLAAHVGEKNSLENPELDREINIGGHKIVLDLILKNNPQARIIFTGSRLQYGKIEDYTTCDGGVCGGSNLPISEEQPMHPITPYAMNKMFGEQMYLKYNQKFGLKTIAVRIANPYGPRASITNPGYCIVNWFIGRALSGKDLPVYGEGTQIRDYIFIDDVVNALVTLGVSENSIGQVYNIGSGKGITFVEMAQLIEKLAQNSSKVKFIPWPEDAKDRETGNFIANINKISRETGWTPSCNLEEGLTKTFEFYKKNQKYYL